MFVSVRSLFSWHLFTSTFNFSEPVDFVVVEAAADDEVEEGRALSDIPRDHSGQ